MNKIRTVYLSLKLSIKLVFDSKEGFKYSILKCVIALFNSSIPMAYTIIPGLIINELLYNKRIVVLAIYVGLLALIPLSKDIINIFANRCIYSLEKDLSLKLLSDFYLYILGMDYETLENPDLQEEQWRARSTYTNSVGTIDLIIELFASTVAAIVYLFIIAKYNWIIALLLFVFGCINYYVKRNVKKQSFKTNKEIDKIERKLSTLSYMFDQTDYGKEFRVLNLKEYLVEKFITLKKAMNSIELTQYKKNNKIGITNSLLNAFQVVFIYFVLISKIVRGVLPVGDLSIGLSASNQFNGKLKAVFDSYLQLYEKSLYVQDMSHFFSISNCNIAKGNQIPDFKNDSIIEFKNVSFRYPGSNIFALKNLNIVIKANERICLVGQNGSGKSTFIKLLLRLYLPTSGEIYLNGKNINEYDYQKYQKLFSPVFQDFVEYEFTAKENIILNLPEDCKKIKRVLTETNLHQLFEKLPNGIETQVGKYVDPEGIELSGGEAQRMAIARALYREGVIYVLDEPTAALDPMAEYEIYTQFHNMIKDKTAILVTHRLSAVQLADKVAVFDDGQIIEYGTHSELYSKGGKYKEMFDKQSEFYVNANLDNK